MRRFALYLRSLMQHKHIRELAEQELAREAAAKKFSEQALEHRQCVERVEAILETIPAGKKPEA